MRTYPRPIGSPAAEPLELSEALAHLRADADGAENDLYVTGLIQVAAQACEDRIDRQLIATPMRLKLEKFEDVIELFAPVISITSVKYIDDAGVLQTVTPADYELHSDSDPALLVPLYGLAWPTTSATIKPVTIEYVAGYGETAASVPGPLRQWILCAITHLYENRAGELPQNFASGLIEPYRAVGV